MQDIKQFFDGKTVFVTGGSGFLGKVLLEKLLRSCPGLDTIYVLIRERKGATGEERLKKITELPLFDRLRLERPAALAKLRPLAGDTSLPGLGLSASDRELLLRRVDVIFHCAASVRFDDPLRSALLSNTRSALEVARLAAEAEREGVVLVHVSTTYCNTDRGVVIEERVYPPRADWRECLRWAEQADGWELDVMTAKVIEPMPNTYTFSKGLAEDAVKETCEGRVRTVIFRPSIVISTLHEPMPGWIDNFNGPVGLLVASGKGIVRTAYGNPRLIADYCPVDVVVKLMIVAAWEKGVSNDISEVSVYNASSSKIRYMRFDELTNIGIKYSHDVPLENQLWFPGGGMTKCYYYFYVTFLLCQLLPAIVIDGILKITGQKPILFKVQRRIFLAYTALQYFLVNEWDFINNNSLSLLEKILPSDREDFFLDINEIDIYVYFRNCFVGVKKYLLKEKMENLEKARFRAKCMYVLSIAMKVLLYTFAVWYLFFKKDIFNVLGRKFIDYANSVDAGGM